MSTAAELPLEELAILDPETFVATGYPHDAWRRLRAEAPVFRYENVPVPFWAITKHADIAMIGKHPELFSSRPRIVIHDFENSDFEPHPTLIDLDPPLHGKYRKIISKRFTPRALLRIHDDIERIAKRIVDDLLNEQDEGEVDFVEKVAAPLPIAVIAWLLGVPESDWNLLFDWTNRIIGGSDPEYQIEGQDSDEGAKQAMMDLFGYFAKLVEERKKKPGDDLVSLFATAEIDGEPFSPIDVLAWCQIIVVAGNETTRNATSGGMLALIQHPKALRAIQADMSRLKPAIEEILRWTSPIIHFARTAAEDMEIRGQQIRKGETLALLYPSANRDEEVFENPFTFDITRQPNRHLAFGIGEHFCAGAHLARLELEMAFKFLLPRIEEIELAGEISRLKSNLVGGIKHLPVRYKLLPE